MAQEAGEETFFLFGLIAEQVAGSRGRYNPRWHYDNQPEIRAALDLIFSDHRLGALYVDPDASAAKAILNVADSGKLSSDHTIAEYGTSSCVR